MSKKGNKGKGKAKFHPTREPEQPDTPFGSQLREALQRPKPPAPETSGSRAQRTSSKPDSPKKTDMPVSTPAKQAGTTLGAMISKISIDTETDPDGDERLWAEAGQ